MAEVQSSVHSGETAQRFVEFVMMHAQQASLFLGRLPHPQTGKTEIMLEPARLFIDQLEMIREKTRGNLSAQETEILNSILSDLQMAYVQAASQSAAKPGEPETAASPEPEPAATAPADEGENKKKFSKSYGA